MVFEPYRLTKEQKKALLDLEEDMRLLKDEIARARRAGLDVSDLEAEYAKSSKLRDGLIREYG